MASQWFYEVAGKQVGPVSSAELLALAQRGTVTYDTPVRKGLDGNWVLAKRVRGLFPEPNATSPSMPTAASEASPKKLADTPPQKPSQPLASDVQVVSAMLPCEEAPQLTAIGNIDSVCPYCGNRLEKKPGARRSAPIAATSSTFAQDRWTTRRCSSPKSKWKRSMSNGAWYTHNLPSDKPSRPNGPISCPPKPSRTGRG